MLLICPAIADDRIKRVQLKNGKVFKDVDVARVTHEGLWVSHKIGYGLLPKDELPPDLAAKYTAAIEEARKALPTKEEAENAAAERERKEKARQAPETRRALSAKYINAGRSLELTEAQVMELNDLLGKCSRISPPTSGECVHYPLFSVSLIECKTTDSFFKLPIVSECFLWTDVPDELQPRVKEFCGKLGKLWNRSRPPAAPKKSRSRRSS